MLKGIDLYSAILGHRCRVVDRYRALFMARVNRFLNAEMQEEDSLKDEMEKVGFDCQFKLTADSSVKGGTWLKLAIEGTSAEGGKVELEYGKLLKTKSNTQVCHEVQPFLEWVYDVMMAGGEVDVVGSELLVRGETEEYQVLEVEKQNRVGVVGGWGQFVKWGDVVAVMKEGE